MMSFTTRELKPRIGTEVFTDVDTLVSGRCAAELRELLTQRGVLIFRGLHDMTDADQIAFAKTIGTVRLEHGNASTKITASKEESPIFAEYALGTYSYHIDGTYTDTPGFASVLRPRVLAPEGGQTQFCNTYALYDDLPTGEKGFFERLQAVHSGETTMRIVYPDPTEEQLANWRNYSPERTHPLVWEHDSGRKSLLLATTIDRFVGMDRAESDALLHRLLTMAEDTQYEYTHDWQLGDVLVWDNTGTMHRVVPFDQDCGRELNRVVLFGEEQVKGVSPTEILA
jgi:alpha-ketoglutarate-dependent taurine dioxygenase